MASKFQNRLVGTVILVAIGVIVLPGLLDGKKKHYKEEFAAIPLVPKPDDQQDSEMVPPVTQPAQNSQPSVVTPPPVHQQQKPTEQVKPKPVEQPKPKPVEQPKPKPTEQPKATEQPKTSEQPKAAETPKQSEPAAPAGQAYVVQLGALKNAAKVNEIVAQLRLSGYRAFTVPSTPVQGQITRIYVGPDASKAKLQGALGELKGISGLGGVVKPYSTR